MLQVSVQRLTAQSRRDRTHPAERCRSKGEGRAPQPPRSGPVELTVSDKRRRAASLSYVKEMNALRRTSYSHSYRVKIINVNRGIVGEGDAVTY